jgi:hypothetical protein
MITNAPKTANACGSVTDAVRMLRRGAVLAMAIALALVAPSAVASAPLSNYSRERPPSHAQASPPRATEPPRSPQSKAQGKPRTQPSLPTAATLRSATGYTKLIEHARPRPQHTEPPRYRETPAPPTLQEPPPPGPPGPPSHAEPSGTEPPSHAEPSGTEPPSHAELPPSHAEVPSTGAKKPPRRPESKARGESRTETALPLGAKPRTLSDDAESIEYTYNSHRAGHGKPPEHGKSPEHARSVRARKRRSLRFAGLDLRWEIGVGVLLIAAGLIAIVRRRRSNGGSPLRR